MTDTFSEFISRKTHFGEMSGFKPLWIPDFLFDFQKYLVDWAIQKGRAAMFADCGLGKTPMQLIWAENVVRRTNGRVLILTPLAVGGQTVRQGERFGVECARCHDGKLPSQKIVVTNYERLHYFNPADFMGVVCDESGILKNFDGKTKAEVIEFMRRLPYRLLCTATAAPNDYIELGNSSEALGDMGYMDMLNRFFKNDQNSNHPNRLWAGGGKWRFRGHSEHDFWRWVCSWARAVRKPSDLGFEDKGFNLPPLNTAQYVIHARTKPEGWLLDMPAHTLEEQRQERRRTVNERCEKAAELVNSTGKSAIAWCNLNDEGDLLEKLIPDAVQVSGKDSDERKEEVFRSFEEGSIRVLISKPILSGVGLNWQHCAHQTFFPSHSFEQWYQAIRRSWRFGQENPVQVDVITSEGEANVLKNLQRKASAAEAMFSRLVELMNNELHIQKKDPFRTQQELPSWL